MCATCDEFDRWIQTLEAQEDARVPLSWQQVRELRAFLEEQKDGHVDAAGEASWNG